METVVHDPMINLQLATSIVQVCLSSGNLERSIIQENVTFNLLNSNNQIKTDKIEICKRRYYCCEPVRANWAF